MSNIQRLDVEVPRTLEKTLGYRGRTRWLELYSEPEVGLVCKDNQNLTIGSTEAWELFVENPILKRELDGRDLYSSNSLLLDRRDRNLYVGERSFVDGLLERPEAQQMLLLMDKDRPKQIAKYRQFGKKFAVYTAICGIGIGVLGGVGYSSFQFYQWVSQSDISDTSTPQSPQSEIPKPTSPAIPDKQPTSRPNESNLFGVSSPLLAA